MYLRKIFPSNVESESIYNGSLENDIISDVLMTTGKIAIILWI